MCLTFLLATLTFISRDNFPGHPSASIDVGACVRPVKNQLGQLDGCIKYCCCVVCFVQPVPEHLTNGVITKYAIGVRELQHVIEINSSDSGVFSARIELMPNISSYCLSIEAATEAGSSPAQYLLVTLPLAGKLMSLIMW